MFVANYAQCKGYQRQKIKLFKTSGYQENRIALLPATRSIIRPNLSLLNTIHISPIKHVDLPSSEHKVSSSKLKILQPTHPPQSS